LLRAAAQVLPVVAAARVAREVELEPRERGAADLDAARQQRQQTDAELGTADARHGLRAEALRVAESRGSHRDADRGEHGELEIALERERTSRGVLDGGRDVGFVVVRVEQHADRDERYDDERDDDARRDADDFEEATHEAAPSDALTELGASS